MHRDIMTKANKGRHCHCVDTLNQHEGDSPIPWVHTASLKTWCFYKSNSSILSKFSVLLKSLVVHGMFLLQICFFSTAGLVCLFRVKSRFMASEYNYSSLTPKNVSLLSVTLTGGALKPQS